MTRKAEARFSCRSVYGHKDGDQEIVLKAVADGGPNDFTEFTPYGDLRMDVTADAPAAGFFEKGATYRLVFEKVE